MTRKAACTQCSIGLQHCLGQRLSNLKPAFRIIDHTLHVANHLADQIVPADGTFSLLDERDLRRHYCCLHLRPLPSDRSECPSRCIGFGHKHGGVDGTNGEHVARKPYVFAQIQLDPGVIEAVERDLKLDEEVIRYLLIRLDD